MSLIALYTSEGRNAKPLEAWGERDGNQYAQCDAQPEKQKREDVRASRFLLGTRCLLSFAVNDYPRQSHRKNSALPNLAFDGDGASLSLNQRLGNGQSQAGARLALGGLPTIRALEDVRQQLRLDLY